MRRLASLGALALVAVGLALPGAALALPAAQLVTPVPTLQGPLVPAPPTPFTGFQATPTAGLRFATSTPAARPNLAATATAAAATITAADATATANVAAPQTAVAQTATALAIPSATPTPAPSPTVAPTLVPSPSPTAPLTPPPTAPPSPTTAPTEAPTAAPTVPAPSPTPDALPLARTVLTRAPIAVGDETIAPGAALQIPLETLLVGGSIPPGTTVRLPSGQVVTLPPTISIPAEDVPSIAAGPVNGILPRASLVGDESFPQGTAVVVPSGTSVLGTLNPNEPILLEPGVVVQVGGRTVTLVEPLLLTVSAISVAAPAQLPPTGEADPVLWPAALGLLMLLGGWRLRRFS
jgi:hypothetical protein